MSTLSTSEFLRTAVRIVVVPSVLVASTLGLLPIGKGLPAFAQTTFTDNFSNGINSNNWSLIQSMAGLYNIDATHGNVQIAKTPDTSPGGIQNAGLNLNLNNVAGGPITGNFSTQVDFSNVVLFPQTGPGLDQFELQAGFANGSIFYDDIDYETAYGGQNVHVWNGQINGVVDTTATQGTFAITRTGSTLSGFFNGNLIFSETDTSALTYLNFKIQNYSGNDPISATFDNFSLTYPTTSASAPEPVSIALLLPFLVVFMVSLVGPRTINRSNNKGA